MKLSIEWQTAVKHCTIPHYKLMPLTTHVDGVLMYMALLHVKVKLFIIVIY